MCRIGTGVNGRASVCEGMNPVFLKESGAFVKEIKIDLVPVGHGRVGEVTDPQSVFLVGVG